MSLLSLNTSMQMSTFVHRFEICSTYSVILHTYDDGNETMANLSPDDRDTTKRITCYISLW